MKATDYLSTQPQIVQTEIVMMDFVEYSKLDTAAQFLAVQTLDVCLRFELPVSGVPIKGIVPNGDGAFFILDPSSVGVGPLLAWWLRGVFTREWKTHAEYLHEGQVVPGVRFAVHFGEVAPISILGLDNFVGSGLNDCSRLTSPEASNKACNFYPEEPQDYLVVSEAAWQRFAQITPVQDTGWVKSMRYRESEWFDVCAKHKKIFKVRLIELHRDQYWFPQLKQSS